MSKRWMMFALLAAVFVSVLALGGCFARETEPQEQVQLPQQAEEVVVEFWDAFCEDDHETMQQLMSQQMEDDRQLSLQVLANRHHIGHDSPLLQRFRELSGVVNTFDKKGEDHYSVVARVKGHPQLTAEQTTQLKGSAAERILQLAGDDEVVHFSQVFSQVLEELEVDSGHTDIQMQLERVDGEWLVGSVPDAGAIFSTFAEGFEKAICDPVSEALILADDVHHISGESSVMVDFSDHEVRTEVSLLPECLLPDAEIVLADGEHLEVQPLIDALAEHPFDWDSLREYLDMGPADFIHRGRFEYDSEERTLAVVLTRRYAVATIDSAVGYVRMDDRQAEFFQIIRGPVEHLMWSPDDEYLAYGWTQAGKGGVDVGVYHLATDEHLSFLKMADIEHLPGQITSMQWISDETLQFEVTDVDEEVTTWELNAEEGELSSR